MALDCVALQERDGCTQRRAPAAQEEQKRHRACLGVEDEAFQEKAGCVDEPWSVKDGAKDTDECAMTSHTEMCEDCEVTSVEAGHDVERVTAQCDETEGILNQLKDKTSAGLTALEKKGLDRKISHQDLTEAETGRSSF